MSTNNNPIASKVGATISGVTNTFTVTNPSDTASSAARGTITVGGASAADPSLNFNVSGVTDWEIGIDNSDSDNLKVSQGTALGTNDTWIMTTSGERTMPLQPSFYSTDLTGAVNATGDGTVFTIIFDDVYEDIGSNYDNTTGIFTAPITGVYIFSASVLMKNLSASHVAAIYTFVGPAGRSIQPLEFNPANLRNGAQLQITGTHVVPMIAAETMKVTIQIAGGGKTVTIGGASNTQFAGVLLN